MYCNDIKIYSKIWIVFFLMFNYYIWQKRAHSFVAVLGDRNWNIRMHRCRGSESHLRNMPVISLPPQIIRESTEYSANTHRCIRVKPQINEYSFSPIYNYLGKQLLNISMGTFGHGVPSAPIGLYSHTECMIWILLNPTCNTNILT